MEGRMSEEREDRKDQFGLKRALDYGYHEHTLWGNFKNVTAAFVINLLWLIVATGALAYLGKLKPNEIQALIQARLQVYSAFPAVLSVSPAMTFFMSCVFAPIWEEARYRWGPLKIANALEFLYVGRRGFGSLTTSMCLLPTIVLFSIEFGLAHGGVMNILFQGVSGLLLSWVYVKSGYRVAVITHGLWNFMVMYGLPIIVSAFVIKP